MPLTSASNYSGDGTRDLVLAEYGKKSVEDLEQRLTVVSNSLSGSYSAINNASHALAAELSPVLREAFEHEKAARGQIEEVLDVFTTKFPKLEELVGQLNQGRVHREGFKDGKTLSKEAKKLYDDVFKASDTLIINHVIGNKTAEAALEHAEQLAGKLEKKLENSLN